MAELQVMLAVQPGEIVAPGQGVVVARDVDLVDAGLEEAGDRESVGRPGT